MRDHSLLVALASLCLTTGLVGAEPAAPSGLARKFDEAAKAGTPTARAEAALREWGRKEPNNPDYYIRGARYYYQRAGNDGISITKGTKSRGAFILTDPKTGKQVGSIGAPEPDRKMLQRAIDLLVEGTKRFPKRLDIWLGLSNLYEGVDDFPSQLKTLRGLVAVFQAHPEGLLGTNGAYPPPIDQNLAQQISNMCSRRFQAQTPKADEEFRELALLAAEAFPKAVYGHNLVGNYYAGIKAEPAKAIPAYRRAVEIAPEDSLVWSNLGICYARLGQVAEAKAAFQKVLSLNNEPRSVEIAQKELEKLGP